MSGARLLPLLAVVVIVTATGCGGGDDGGDQVTTGGGSTKAIKLPRTLDGFRDVVDVTADKASGTAVNNQRRRQESTRQKTVAAYRKAYGGAAADYRAYSDDALQRMPWVIAVRAPSPGLVAGPVTDPKTLLLATPDHEVKTVGQVSCLVTWSPPTPYGKPVATESEVLSNCQRSSRGVTVFVGAAGSFRGPSGLQDMVDLTNAAWTAASQS